MMLQWIVAVFLILCLAYTNASQCIQSGRFVNDEIPSCQGYSMCISSGYDIFTQYNLTCPPTFVFNPIDKVCTNVTTFQCNNVNYNCTLYGYFEYLDSSDCSSYIACVEGLNKKVPIEIYCAPNTVYNPSVMSCVNSTEYVCDRAIAPQASAGGDGISSGGIRYFSLYVLGIWFMSILAS